MATPKVEFSNQAMGYPTGFVVAAPNAYCASLSGRKANETNNSPWSTKTGVVGQQHRHGQLASCGYVNLLCSTCASYEKISASIRNASATAYGKSTAIVSCFVDVADYRWFSHRKGQGLLLYNALRETYDKGIPHMGIKAPSALEAWPLFI